ncbi:MAG: trypsin-like peptidase domain-containing protein [Pseudomonadota bacterium]
MSDPNTQLQNLKRPELAASAFDDELSLRLLEEAVAQIEPSRADEARAASIASLLHVAEAAREAGAEALPAVRRVAERLRHNRAFDSLLVFSSQLRRDGLTDVKIRRLEIQSLIELGAFDTALELARPMMTAGAPSEAWREGYSAVGRIYKQRYVNAVAQNGANGEEGEALYLRRAYAAYKHVWDMAPSRITSYHAVNALALLRRAERDGLDLGAPGVKEALAKEILRVIDPPESAWCIATRAETLLAIDCYDEAAEAYGAFAQHKDSTLFHLGGALRQVEEVWGLSGEDKDSGAPVRILKAAILVKQSAMRGGAEDNEKQRDQSAEMVVSQKELRLLNEDFSSATSSSAPTTSPTPSASTTAENPKGFERIFSVNAPLAIGLIRNGLDRARAICRIDATMGGVNRGFGTGFAATGKIFFDGWGEEPVIVTNNHVISSAPNGQSQPFDICTAVFTDPDTDEERSVRFERIEWESDVDAHDIAILRPAEPLPPGVKALENWSKSALPPQAESDEGIGRVYVIGHPAAGPLSFSFADNIFLDHDAKIALTEDQQASGIQRRFARTSNPVRLHYKAPTLGGSSGSPVFDQASFELIGVHHRGLPQMPRLRGREGVYAANQGIWIESIRAAIAECMAENAEAAESASTGERRRWRSLRNPRGRTSSTSRIPTVPTPDPAASGSAPIFGVPLGGGAPDAASTTTDKLIIPGAVGELPAGASPAAAQMLKSGRINTDELNAMSHESVLGDDDRSRIFDTNMSPWRMICALRAYWGNRMAVGTGFLIGPNTLLTAGHCVYPKNRRSLPDRLEVIPGLSGDQLPFGGMDASRVSVHPQWQSSFDRSCDVAAVHLPESIGQRLGWFSVGVRAKTDLSGRWSHVTGYPGEKAEPRTDPATGRPLPPLRAAQLWHHATPVIDVSEDRVFYATDTTGGQSGSPIYIMDENSPTPIAIGVHAYGMASTPGHIGEGNSGPWINDALFKLILDWRNVL